MLNQKQSGFAHTHMQIVTQINNIDIRPDLNDILPVLC